MTGGLLTILLINLLLIIDLHAQHNVGDQRVSINYISLKGRHMVGDSRTFINLPADLRKARVSSMDIMLFVIKDKKILDSALVQINSYDTLGNVTQMLFNGERVDYIYEKGNPVL